ncbi:hypothetical protein BpHYR1_049050 [Brachionus plicatilis]|uniref:Uncharacterized protein n=1 Tax=Brachionus plicatilis TaxID=10195 RepID=A0A3M7PRU8_BRAPC|nr:hypothetical protein BpHYR1_049050 [Brachionus plicatilis]
MVQNKNSLINRVGQKSKSTNILLPTLLINQIFGSARFRDQSTTLFTLVKLLLKYLIFKLFTQLIADRNIKIILQISKITLPIAQQPLEKFIGLNNLREIISLEQHKMELSPSF